MMADVKRPTTGAVLSRPVARHRAEVVVIGSQARRNRSIAGLRVVRSYPVMRIYPAAAIVIDNDDRVVVVVVEVRGAVDFVRKLLQGSGTASSRRNALFFEARKPHRVIPSLAARDVREARRQR